MIDFRKTNALQCKIYNVAFVGLYYEENLGDVIIAKCVEELYRSFFAPNVKIITKHIAIDELERNPTKVFKTLNLLRRISSIQKTPIQKDRSYHKLLKRIYEENYCKTLRNIDLVVVVGGGLIKFRNQYFGDSLEALLNICQKYNIPAIFNAVGVEGYDEDDWKCNKIEKLLSIPSLKAVSTRDDIDTLTRNYYHNKPSIPCNKVADPAVWAAEIYGCNKSDSNIVGIGIIREDIFSDYGYDYSSAQLRSLYQDVIMRLINEGLQVELFTNGAPLDMQFAKSILDWLSSQNVDIKLKNPNDAKDLIRIISNYTAIVAGRLHSCIIAYSLNIGAVGLVWNNKLSMFGKNIGMEDYYIRSENLTPDVVCDRLNHFIGQSVPYNELDRETFRNSIKMNINTIVSKYLPPPCPLQQ